MILKGPVPDLIRDGSGFSDKIILINNGRNAPRVMPRRFGG